VWRLTPITYLRQFWLTLEPASVVGVIASTIVGPWASIVVALFAVNPIFIFEVDLIVKVAQFMAIGWVHRKIRSPWNILGIPLGVSIALMIHPTLVQYILSRQVIVYLFWGQNFVFQFFIYFFGYLLVRLLVPQIFEWTDPSTNYKLNLDFLRPKHEKKPVPQWNLKRSVEES